MAYEPPPRRLGLGIGICLVAFLFFVTASSLVWGFRGKFPTIQIIFIQNAVSFLVVLPLALRKGFLALRTACVAEHLIRDLFGVGSYYLYFLAIRYLDLVDATTLNYTAPFFAPLMWWIWKKEKVGLHVWWAIIVGFVGVAVILNPSRLIFQLGFVYGLFGGIASAVAFCGLRVLNLKREPMSRTLFYYFLFGMIVSAPFAFVLWETPNSREWCQALVIGGATAIGQILLTIAYRYGTASYLSPLGYTSVIYAGFIGWFFLDQSLGLRNLIGAALIILGGVTTFVLKKKPANLAETFETPKPHERPPL